MFLMSVSLARPRPDEAFPIAQRRSARVKKFSNELSVESLLASRHLFLIGPTALPLQCWCVLQRGHVGLLQSAFHVRSINGEVVPLLRSRPGFVPGCVLVSSSLPLELQVSAQFSDDFLDDLVRSRQQQVVHV